MTAGESFWTMRVGQLFKRSRSDLQFRDVRQMLSTVSELDWKYMQKWATILGLTISYERRRKMSDTPTRIAQRYKEMLLSRTPSERLRMASRMYDSGRKLVISGIQNGRQPLNASQLRGQLFLRMYGCDFTAADRERIINRIPNMQLDTDS